MARKQKSKTGVKRPRAIAAQELHINVGHSSNVPLFAQIRDQIHDYVASGSLQPGMRLPPVRTLARQLGLNQITVAKAYRELAERNLIEGRRGGGSFVRAGDQRSPVAALSAVGSRPLLAERLFELARAPGVIAFSSNYPVADSETIANFRNCLMHATEHELESCFRYDPPLGRTELRKQIQACLQNDGIPADADNILVTSGGQQAIDLAARVLTQPGTPVIIEQPAYYGAINAFRGARARILEVPLEADGMNLEILEHHLMRSQARLIYTNPTFQNPTGITMSLAKRQALLALARRFGAVILEDDHSHELRFSGNPAPAIRALASQDDLVLYARGFGKTILPGTRLGYLVMPDALRQSLLATKAHVDLHSNGLIQEAVARFIARGHHVETLERMRNKYRPRQRTLHKSLETGIPEGATVTRPDGGLSLWLTLPEGADVSELYFRAVRRGVAFVAGDVFYAAPSHPRSLRISFGFNKDEEMKEGVLRLCSVVKDLLSPRSGRSGRSLIMM